MKTREHLLSEIKSICLNSWCLCTDGSQGDMTVYDLEIVLCYLKSENQSNENNTNKDKT
jgi:hypothetical protein